MSEVIVCVHGASFIKQINSVCALVEGDVNAQQKQAIFCGATLFKDVNYPGFNVGLLRLKALTKKRPFLCQGAIGYCGASC